MSISRNVISDEYVNGNSTDVLYPPLRFGRITPKLYRGAYPTLKNFRFLKRISLKVVISLVPEPPTEDLVTFCASEGIELIYFQVVFTIRDNIHIL